MSISGEIFSERLKTAMQARGLSAAEIARRMHTTPSTVFAWLQGTVPRRRAQLELASLLGLSENYDTPAEKFVNELSRAEVSAAIEKGYPISKMIADIRDLLSSPTPDNIRRAKYLLDMGEAQLQFQSHENP
jgi:transcriptional regulator with XRE-family HTH domain